MREIILNFEKQTLDSLDMSLSKHIDNEEYQIYFNEPASREHYRLLTQISNSFNDINIMDIGTLKGCSALALSTNKSNTVHSFNVINQLELIDVPSNINFTIGNVINGKYKDLILDCKIILLDTFHDGTFEKQFVDYLLSINYKGLVLFDDIKLNNEMIDFWNSIKIEKYDISDLGHVTGTGLVVFS